MAFTKDEILERVGSYDILTYYLTPYTRKKLLSGKLILSPLREEKHPSFNIYLPYGAANRHGWRWKDFAAEGGDCFELVQQLFNISFVEALQKINDDFNLGLNSDQLIMSNNPGPKLKETINGPNYAIVIRPFTEQELGYWLQFGIALDHLKAFNVAPVESFTAKKKDGTPYTIHSTETYFIFAYLHDTGAKLYKPLENKKEFRFQHLGTKPEKFTFGFAQLSDKGDTVLITGGEKDVLTLTALGYNAISLNSETSNLDASLVNDLKTRFKNVCVLYDSDETGLKQSEKLSKQHNLHKITLPQIENIKDISDYVKERHSIDRFRESLSEQLQPKASSEDEYRKLYYYNALELLALDPTVQRYLIKDVLPAVGTAVLVGKPDTGKSQFARHLALCVCFGLDSFLGFELFPRHKRALFIATEDDINNTRFLLEKQLNGMNQQANDHLQFIFADVLTREEIMIELQRHLNECPCDLVVIDSFGDIFKGTDQNSNQMMRNTVRDFDQIAKKFGCLILFVHHITKNSYNQIPAQEHIQGGAGLVQKVRSALYLSPGEGNTKYLTLAKGNYSPKQLKDNSIELIFNEKTFLFTHTGSTVPVEKLSHEKEEKEEVKLQTLINIAELVFKGKTQMRYTQIAKEIERITGQGSATAGRYIRQLTAMEIIVKDQNGYYTLQNPETLSDEEKQELGL